jgi:hypothetical protein
LCKKYQFYNERDHACRTPHAEFFHKGSKTNKKAVKSPTGFKISFQVKFVPENFMLGSRPAAYHNW